MERLASAYKFMVEYAKRTNRTELDTQSIENRIKALGAIVRKEEKTQKALDDANKRANEERKRIADEQNAFQILALLITRLLICVTKWLHCAKN